MTLVSKNSLAEAALRLDGLFFPDGQMRTRLWARLNPATGERLATHYTYTGQGQLAGIDYADDTPDVTYTYNARGQVTRVTDGTGTRTYDYDPATFALTAENYVSGIHAGSNLHRAYDVYNRPTGYALVAPQQPIADSQSPGAAVTTAASYTYDPNGRLNTVSGDTIPDGLNLNAERNTLNATTFSYARLANSDLIETVTGPVHRVLNAYEPNRDVLTVKTNQLNTGGIVSRYAYTYDALARRTTRTQSGNAFDGIGYALGTELPATMTGIPGSGTSTDTFSYNPRSEVTGSINDKDAALNRGYGYDPIGNRISAAELNVSKEYDANALNQYTAIRTSGQSASSAVNNLTYDADGNMLADGEGKLYAWDAENRLIAVTLPNGEIVKYGYDAGSHRLKREHLSAGKVETTLYAYDDWNVVSEKALLNSSFLNLKCYTWGLDLSNTLQRAGGVGGMVCAKHYSESALVVFNYLFDANGNVCELLDAGSLIRAHYVYDVFGNLLISSGSGEKQNVFKFSTKALDDTVGLYYYGYRYYDVSSGRWVSRDRIDELGGFCLYAFVRNNANDFYDQLGLRIGPATVISTYSIFDHDTFSPDDEVGALTATSSVDCDSKGKLIGKISLSISGDFSSTTPFNGVDSMNYPGIVSEDAKVLRVSAVYREDSVRVLVFSAGTAAGAGAAVGVVLVGGSALAAAAAGVGAEVVINSTLFIVQEIYDYGEYSVEASYEYQYSCKCVMRDGKRQWELVGNTPILSKNATDDLYFK